MSNVKAIRVGTPHFKIKLLQRIAWNKLTIVLMARVAKGIEFDNIINSTSSLNKEVICGKQGYYC